MANPRTPEVDVIRLIALLGICIINIPAMGLFSEAFSEQHTLASHNQLALFFTSLLVEGKFILLFSFIFGWGIAIQQKRFVATGNNFKTYYCRRAFGLMLLGLLHMAFIFGGDILVTYGLLSLFFWFMRDYVLRTSTQRFVITMFGLTCLSIMITCVLLVSAYFVIDMSEFLELNNTELGGSFYEATRYRLQEGAFVLALSLGIFLFHSLAAFGLGYSAFHSGFFNEDSNSFLKLKQVLPKLIIIGLLCNAPYALSISEIIADYWLIPGILLWLIGAPALSAVYLYSIITITRRIKIPEILIHAGRNSLSVYVLQGLIASLMFGGYGLGWFDKFGELALIPIAIGIYLLTIFIVGWYAQKYGHGRGFLEPILRRISGS